MSSGKIQPFNQHEFSIDGRFLKTAKLRYEWLEDLAEPELVIQHLKETINRPDLFVFWQRLPDTKPNYHFFYEWDSIAAIPLTTYENWWNKQINPKTRNLVRKAEKAGVTVGIVPFDECLIKGITGIFNESPIRQGRKFNHFGKSEAQVKSEMGRRLEISEFIGAYFKDELIGFIKLLHADRYTMTVEIISKLEHRDKSTQNALVNYAVKHCCGKGIPYLIYSRWIDSSLGSFKRHNGFEKYDLPRYVVPISMKGKVLLRTSLYGILKRRLPPRLHEFGKNVRLKIYSLIGMKQPETS